MKFHLHGISISTYYNSTLKHTNGIDGIDRSYLGSDGLLAGGVVECDETL